MERESESESEPEHDEPSVDHATWSARFGWIVGGILGLVVGFALTLLVDTRVLANHSPDPSALASRLSSVLVPALFLAGALGGHAFGARGGPGRYRALGVAAGISLAALGWALLVLTR